MAKKQQLDFLSKLARGIAGQFGPRCEVAVHDLRHPLESTIIAIENGHVTGRHVGDGPSEIALQAIRSKDIEDRIGYMTRTQDGRLLRSSTIYLRDEKGEAVALFGINYDITEITQAASVLGQLTGAAQEKKQREPDTIFSNVNDLLDRLIEESCEFVGKPVALMTKEDKTRAIHYLDSKGAFLIKKAGDRVSKFYDISKYTLYNYMDSEAE